MLLTNQRVIIGAAEKRGFPRSFAENLAQQPQWDSTTMENQGRLTPPPGWRRDLLAWGETDPETNLMPIYTPNGLWFTMDMSTGKEVTPEAQPEPSDADYAAILHESADRAETVSLCYFIGADDGPVKIGHSVDVQGRLRTFQAGCPVRLKVLATRAGGETREVAYHWQFREHRAHGEWFERHPDILAEIERIS